MRSTKTVRRLAQVWLLCLGLLAMILPIAAQNEPTGQQATIDAMVQQYFDQTATASAELEQTQTLQAAFETAQTATAAFDATVQAAFQEAATATQLAMPTPTPASVPDQVVSIEETDLVAGRTGQTVFLAPDGERFAHVTLEPEICIYTVAGALERCVSLEDRLRSVNIDWVRWSADSSKLVFTENFLILFHEPDLWVIDADDGSLTNLTDDHQDEFPLGDASGTPPDLDVAPVWMSDGRIAFLRYTDKEEGYAASLLAIDPESGEVEHLASFGIVRGLPITTFDFAPDESFLIYNWFVPSSDGDDSGLRLLDLASGEERILFSASSNIETPYMVSVSPSGQYVLWMDGRAAQFQASEPEDSSMRVLPLSGGDPMLVDEDVLVYAAWWAPEGEALAYISANYQNPDESGLYVSPVPGQSGQQVVEGQFLPPVTQTYLQVMWSENHTIALADAETGTLRLIQLGD